jgi:hypothetical protein
MFAFKTISSTLTFWVHFVTKIHLHYGNQHKNFDFLKGKIL